MTDLAPAPAPMPSSSPAPQLQPQLPQEQPIKLPVLTDDSDTTVDSPSAGSSSSASNHNPRPPLPVRKPKSEPLPSATLGKGGCWTCRVRRKRCDEQVTDGQCHTCLRLRIDCLGWGQRRPEWMRDKAAVDEYKSKIKEQLMKQGMIRGQPRRDPNGNTPYTIPMAGGMAHYVHAGSIPQYYAQTDGVHGHHHHARATLPGPWHSTAAALQDPAYAKAAAGQVHEHAAHFVYADPQNAGRFVESPVSYGPPVPYGLQPTGVHVVVPTHGPPLQYDPRMHAPAPPSALGAARENHVMYYFRRVRRMQYMFAGPDVTRVFTDVIVREPHGSVTSAICSLAALHNARMRLANGLHDPTAGGMVDRRFYDDAFWQINRSKQLNGRFTEVDATAAVHAISYWLFQGGSGDWELALNVAREWLANLPVSADPNPILGLLQFDDTSKFASRATMWMDIFSSITTVTPPRFLEMYRRLFKGGTGGEWAPTLGSLHNELRMDGLMGCPDEVMLAIAEVAHLAWWKAHRMRAGRLSVRELVMRADAIEKELRTQETLRTWSRNISSTSYNDFDRLLNGDQPPEQRSTFSGSTAPSSTIPSPCSTNPSPLPAVPSAQTPVPASASTPAQQVSALPPQHAPTQLPQQHPATPLQQVATPLPQLPTPLPQLPTPLPQVSTPLSQVPPQLPTPLATHGHGPLPQQLPTPIGPQAPTAQTADDDMRTVVSSIFREAAILYLYSVMSGPFPEVPEIIEAVAAIIDLLARLPVSEYDRSLVFPICLAGCMTNETHQRDFLRARLQLQDGHIGNVAECLRLMEAVWERRDKDGINANWLEVMRELGINLLLV